MGRVNRKPQRENITELLFQANVALEEIEKRLTEISINDPEFDNVLAERDRVSVRVYTLSKQLGFINTKKGRLGDPIDEKFFPEDD